MRDVVREVELGAPGIEHGERLAAIMDLEHARDRA
jgi:hypothetical protein